MYSTLQYRLVLESEKLCMTQTNLKEKAIELRQQGLTYREISQLLNGAVSVDQCKRWLKGVCKSKPNDACVEELVALGSRPEGITEYEATGIIFKYHPDFKEEDITNIKKEIKEAKK